MRILLVPWGRGMGHITRCLAIAEQAVHAIGQDYVSIVAEDQWHRLIEQVGCSRLSFPQELLSGSPWDGWEDVEQLQSFLEADLRMLEVVQPSMVISDIRPSLSIACAVAGISCITVAQCIHHPDFCYPESFWTDVVPSFNTMLDLCKLPLLHNDLRELYFRNPVLIPGIPEFDPLPGAVQQTQVWYTGPLLFRTGVQVDLPERAKRSTIFVYGVIRTQDDLEQLLCAFRGEFFHFLITGLPSDQVFQVREQDREHVSFYSFVDIQTILPDCTAAIIHGGHGSCMTALVTGTPVVVLPGSEGERTVNGRHLETMGVAQCLPGDIVWAEACRGIRCVIEDPTYRKQAQKWQQRLRQWTETPVAWNILAALAQKR